MVKYALEILSPVHIGNGNKLNQASFLVEKDNVYIVDPDVFVSLLPRELKDKLIKIAENGKKLNLYKFLPSDQKETFKRKILYKISLFSSPFHPLYSQNRKCRLFEIDEFIKVSKSVYIPGSELKGAIRTAVIFQLIQDNFNKVKPLIQKLCCFPVKQMIRQGRGLSRNEKKRVVENIKKIENEIQNFLMRGTKKDAKYDLLKLLQISDSKEIPAEDSLNVGKIVVLDCKKGILRFANYQEILRPTLRFEVPTIAMPETEKKNIIMDLLGFSDIQKKIVSHIDSLFHIAYKFTEEIINAEREYFNKIVSLPHNSRKNILKQLDNVAEKNTPRTPVIRIGMGEGLLSHTIWLAIKRRDSNDLYGRILKIQQNEIFPKSRRLCEDRNGNYYTMGWTRIIESQRK